MDADTNSLANSGFQVLKCHHVPIYPRAPLCEFTDTVSKSKFGANSDSPSLY